MVATVAGGSLSTRTATVRRKQAAFPCLVADAMQVHYEADLGWINGGFIRNNSVYPEVSTCSVLFAHSDTDVCVLVTRVVS